jgi:homoaconitase/3-isopropylmalate dehydratase large subunit
MEDRMTLCNMVVEAGGKIGVVPADATTSKYLEGKTTKPYQFFTSDGNASFLQEYRFDVSKLEPLVAKPHSPDNRGLARECKDVKIDRVYIGSCTGGKTEDFLAAAELLAISVSYETHLKIYACAHIRVPSHRIMEVLLTPISLTGPKGEGSNFPCTCYTKGVDGLVHPASTWH